MFSYFNDVDLIMPNVFIFKSIRRNMKDKIITFNLYGD